jgi:general secretion pathway protein D
MKTIPLPVILFLTALTLAAQTPPPVPPANRPPSRRPANIPFMPPAAAAVPAVNSPGASPGSAAANDQAANEKPGYTYNFPGVDVDQVLDVYADLVGRTLLIGQGLPKVSITLKTQSPLTRSEAIEALQAVLAMNGISVINIGDKFVKVVPSAQANQEAAPFNEAPASQLPELGTYVTHIVQLHYVTPSKVAPILQQFGKLPNAVFPIDDNGILVIRDYAENVKRMLEMLKQIDVSVPAVYISKVIPIRYAQAADIANALNSLGGQGSATVSFGTSSAPSPISGFSSPRSSGLGMGAGGINQPGTTPFGQQTTPFGAQANANGTARPGITPVQQRLLNIINRASSPTGGGEQAPIQVFGQAKIIADERSNSLLVFATKDDMERIESVVKDLDVLLPQVLIESAIIDYSLGPNSFNFALSAAQNPQQYSSNPQSAGAGGINNSSSGSPFLNLFNLLNGGSLSNSVFGNNLAGGLSYFGNIGPHWDLALTAAAADSHATIVQRPSVMTSQAKPAQFFVGNTVPYITGYGNYGYGNQSTYSQLSVGVEMDVTPFINPEGLVVMDINQEIDALNGFTTIQNVGDVPNTIKRTLSSEVAVHDKDTIMLGGFIENDKSTSRAGVPLLMDIPVLGNLFASRSDKKTRQELIVLMRPTVLKTPELAAAQTAVEEKRLPGVTAAEADEAATLRKAAESERKRERKESFGHNRTDLLFAPPPPANPSPGRALPASSENNLPAPPPEMTFTNQLELH